MTDADEVHELNQEQTLVKLQEHVDGLTELQENPEVQDYAADEYIDEATESLEAAMDDIRRGLNEAANADESEA